jgi:hypothetical protein
MSTQISKDEAAQLATKRLLDEIAKKDKEIADLKRSSNDIAALQNRCFALSSGSLCIFCEMKKRCWRNK